MSWLSDITSILGIPASGAALATAVYGGCALAEKEARKEAISDIAKIIQGERWRYYFEPATAVKYVFENTFGITHFSVKCFSRSAAATIIVILCLATQFILTGRFITKYNALTAGMITVPFIFLSIIIDYVALYKTRELLKAVNSRKISIYIAVFADVISTLFLFIAVHLSAISVVTLYMQKINGYNNIQVSQELYEYFSVLTDQVRGLYLHTGIGMPILGLFFSSAMITSVWTILILTSTIIMSFMIPIQKATNWFFPVDKHPIKAIGIVAAGLIMLGSFAWALIRPLFA